MKSKIEKNIRNYVNKVWKDNDDNLGFRIGDNNKIEEIGRLEFTKKELLKYSTLLIDHLNSQDQEEEEEVNKMYDFNERKITTYIVGEDKVITILRQDEMPEWLKKGDIRVFKDTPEEWENKFFNFTEDMALEGYLPNGDMASMEDMRIFIQSLLDGKEREAKEELLKELIVVVENGIPEEFQKELDKLNNKKK